MADPADHRFLWENLDRRLLSSKLDDISKNMHEHAVAEERRIHSEVRKRGNSAGYLPRLLEFHERSTDEWARRVYDAHVEAWEQQNRTITPAFVRAVFDEALAPLIASRVSSVIGEVTQRATRTKRAPNAVALRAFARRMAGLASRWRNNLEATAVAVEYCVTPDRDRATINAFDEHQVRDALAQYEAGSRQAITRIAALEQALARGERNVRRLWPVRNNLRIEQQRHKTFLRLCGLARERLQTLSGADFDKERNSAGKKGDANFSKSGDYCSIKYKGVLYRLTPNQSKIVRMLHDAYLAGTPALRGDTLLAALEAETSRVRDSFKNSPLWGTLIVSNRSPRGTYQLKLE